MIKTVTIDHFLSWHGKSRITVAFHRDGMLSYNELQFSDTYLEKHPVVMNQLLNAYTDTGGSVKLYGTNTYFEQLEHLVMVDGAFFGEQALAEGRNVAIISDQLALSLYKSDKATSNYINIEGILYEIIGVYKKYQSVGDYLTADGYEKILIPITSDAVKNIPIDCVIFDGTYLEQMPTSDKLGEMGINEALGTKRDQTDLGKEMYGISQIPMIIAAFIFILIGGKVLIKKESELIVSIKNEKRQNIRRRLIGSSIIFLSIFILIGAVVCNGALKGAYIKASALPAENIFDLSFYWEAMKQEWVTRNQLLRTEVVAFEQLVHFLKTEIHCLNILQYVMIGSAIMSLKKLINR